MLPVLQIEGPILTALRDTGRVVLTAPTGSGKTTQVPQILLRAGTVKGQIIVLQPRRLATRMVAQRVARELGSSLGETVGYQTRHDSKISARTRVRFMTEGLFLRLLQSSPRLPGIGAVLLDEFHERSVAADVSLGLLRKLRETERPDLQIVVMSATLDASAVAGYLGCTPLAAGGRLFPIETRYLPRRSQLPPWDLAAEALRSALNDPPDGDVLIFMPGAYEINRTIDTCRAAAGGHSGCLRFFPLHGSLAPAEQDAAVAPCTDRKVIVATNVAETSITIEGVRCVIDSGLARVHRYDADRGINVLHVEPISRASADQRSGRAGRTAPGICLRLWTEQDHLQVREERDAPEVQRIELSEPILQLRSMGVPDISHFPWLDPPPLQAVERAEELLKVIGALDPAGALTDLGLRMADIPAHPRLSRMLLAAAETGCLPRAARWAALIGERDITLKSANLSRFLDPDEPPSDLAVRERALAAAAEARFDPRRCDALGLHANTARQVEQTARLLLNTLPTPGRSSGSDTCDLVRALLAGFPDHVAMKLDRSRPHCSMPGRKRATLDPASVVKQPGPILAVELHEIGRRDNTETVLSLASALDPAWLDPSRITTRLRTAWNDQARAVEQVEERLYGDLVLETTHRPEPDPATAAEILIERIVAGELKLEQWNEPVTQWIERVRCTAAWFPEHPLIRYEPDDLRVILHEIVAGATRASQLQDRPCLDALRNALDWDDQQFVERMAPATITLPSGYRMKLTYEAGASPRGRAKVQDFYGLNETPRVAAGRQPVLLEILAPSQRPIQVTADLANFWKTLYPQMRNELRRRYPKHDWR